MAKKTLYGKALSWLQYEEHRLFPQFDKPAVKPGSLAYYMFEYRVMQAKQLAPKKVLFIGDSRLQEFENLIDAQNPEWCDLAVSSSKTPDWLEFGPQIIQNSQCQIVIDDIAGNDILGGAPIQDVIKNKVKWIQVMRSQPNVKAVLVYEICPLGVSTYPQVNAIVMRSNAEIFQYNTYMSANAESLGIIWIPLSTLLAPGGLMLQQYNCGDGIHWSAIAYPQVILPQTEDALKKVPA